MNEEAELKFQIGFDKENPDVMVIQIPIKKYAEDREDGMAMFYGKMREAEAMGGRVMTQIRQKKAMSSVIGPNGKPMLVA